MKITEPIGIIGGTGSEGIGLAQRLTLAGCNVMIGSREKQRAEATVSRLSKKRPSLTGRLVACTNGEAASESAIVILSIPYSGQTKILHEIGPNISGKIILSVVAPIQMHNGVAIGVPPSEGSAAEAARSIVPSARWVAGFHTISARDLSRTDLPIDADALVCGDDDEAKKNVMAITKLIKGVRVVDAGPYVTARYLEATTALLININKIYRSHASIKIVGL